MSIAEYKKKRNNTKEIKLEFFSIKIRKLKSKDYVGLKGVPSLYTLSKSEESEKSKEDNIEELYKAIKIFVCACVIGVPEKDMPSIVDKPETQCADWEISFDDTLSDEDAAKIFNEIQAFTLEGGIGQDNLAVFREKQESPEGGNDDGKRVREVSA